MEAQSRDAVAQVCAAHGLQLDERIGAGGFADVWSARPSLQPDRRVAVKVMRRASSATNELAALSELRGASEHIVNLERHFEDEAGNTYIVTELARPGEELFELIHRCRRLSEAEARHHLRQILTGVARIHQRGWAHRDLKLENVIAVRGGGATAAADNTATTDKIIDFGFAARTGTAPGATCTGVIGTAHYVAPEVVFDRSYDGRAVDMFACGVMLYVLLYGEYPFPRRGNYGIGPKLRESQKAAFRSPLHFRSSVRVSAAAKQFIRSLLSEEPLDRPTVHQALADPWLWQDYVPPAPPPPAVEDHAVEPPEVQPLARVLDGEEGAPHEGRGVGRSRSEPSEEPEEPHCPRRRAASAKPSEPPNPTAGAGAGAGTGTGAGAGAGAGAGVLAPASSAAKPQQSDFSLENLPLMVASAGIVMAASASMPSAW